MKRILALCAAGVLLPLLATGQAVRLTRYEGSPIRGIEASSAFDVHLVGSNQPKVVVEIDETLEERLNLSLSDDGIVRISLQSGSMRMGNSKKSGKRNPVLKATVCLDELTYLKGSGAVTFTVEGKFQSRATRINLSGATDLISLDLDAEKLVVNNAGASEASIKVQAGELDVTLAGASDLTIDARVEIAKLTASGASDFVIRGEAAQADIKVSSGSDVSAANFRVGKLTINASGASDAAVWAVDHIEANASSASSIRYKGEPASFQTKATSASSIKKMK